MISTQPNRVEDNRVVFSDSASAAQELRSRCMDLINCTAAASPADLRHALAGDSSLSGVVLIAPVEAFAERILDGVGVQQALEETRSTLGALISSVRDYRERLVLVDLSHASPNPSVLADRLALPSEEHLEGFSCGDPDPVLRAVASQVLADDPACRTALDFLEASSAISPVSPSLEDAERALNSFLSLRQRASDATALQAEITRMEAMAKLSDSQIQTMTKELRELGADLEAADQERSALRERLEETEARLEESAQRQAELSQQLAILRTRIDRIRGFWTVRATKPIRRLGKLVRKSRHG